MQGTCTGEFYLRFMTFKLFLKSKKCILSIGASILLLSNVQGQNIFPSNGNVGIGTTNILTALHVSSPLNGISAIGIGNESDAGNYQVPLGTSPGGYNIDFFTYRDVIRNLVGARIRAERINIHQPNSALVQAMDLSFQTGTTYDQSTLSEKMRVTWTGNVGIGTSTPQEKLSVNGSIKAKEIKVENANWPDYVFNEDYKSLPLEKLEAYIIANKHLPNIPSAKEVNASGINLSEMSSKLLEKIEELTLILINQDKQLKDLQARLVGGYK